MINKLLKSKGYSINSQDSITYLTQPLRTGSFLVYIRLPDVIQSTLSNTSEVEDLLITSVKGVDIPNSSIIYEPLHNGRQLYTNLPMSREDTLDFTIRFYETVDCDISSILELWLSAIADPIHHTPLFNKKFGESYLNKIKTTITIFIFDPTILEKLQSSLILKLYGSSIENLDRTGFNTDYESHDLTLISATFKCDRIVPLTKSIARLYGMESIFVQTEHALLSTIEYAKKEAYQVYAKQLKELLDKLSQVTEHGGVHQ